MHVLDVVLHRQDERVRDAADALTAWYWHVKKIPYEEVDYVTLRDLTALLWERLAWFQRFGCSMATPKIHCAAKLHLVIRAYGSVEHVTTDAYERAHKVHKAVFRRCVMLSVADFYYDV